MPLPTLQVPVQELSELYKIHLYITDQKGNKFPDDILPRGEELIVHLNCSKVFAAIGGAKQTILTGDYTAVVTYESGIAEKTATDGFDRNQNKIENASRAASFKFIVPMDADRVTFQIKFKGAEDTASEFTKTKRITLEAGDANLVRRDKPTGRLEDELLSLFPAVRRAD
jgi:hypothetical protein